jgi:predicted 3-demethylubiquinone-9 3-methyltransferase (glyoxalase superfamily)
MQKLTTFLWFDGQAEDAMKFYTSVFKDSKAGDVMCWPDKPGNVLTTSFEVMGQQFVALNGGPQYKLSEAVSFMIPCETQADVDYYWDKLMDGGQSQACGWLKDKFGVSWQVTPTVLMNMINDPDRAKAKRVMDVMMTMIKLEIAPLVKAYEG